MSRIKHIAIMLMLLSGTKVDVYAQITAKPSPGYPAEVLYGVNNFARITVHELPNGLTRFFVPGKQNAKRIVLSGSFNNWSTLQGLMFKTDSGWIKDVHLEPGIYNYKYIFDGNWFIDANNNLKKDDGAGNLNSVYYRYNFSFKLAGYTGAHRVVVSGNFNKWNAGELIMNRDADGWSLKLYVHDGNHQYHFLVDGHVVTDPANKVKAGNQNSVLSIGEIINFKLSGYGNAHHVYVAGTFNDWNPESLPMENEGGVWVLPYTLAAGNYQYKFNVDGRWITDPLNPHTATLVGKVNSFIAVSPNYIFRLKGYSTAKGITLSGTFNNWNTYGYTLEHKNDEWVINVRLNPGKNLYKFIVDGGWIIDPGNKLWEQNVEGTGNSVLWIN
jgi:1,4-alpha-glucan branching enzyme